MQSPPAGNRRRGHALSGAPSRQPHKSRGQALVEFALLAPLMLLLLAIGVDAGRLFFTWIEVVNSAREGAAYAAGNPTDTSGITVKSTQEANAQQQGGEGAATVVTTCANPANQAIACAVAAGGNGSGNTVTVRVTRSFSFLTPMVTNVVGSSFAISGRATTAVFGLLPNGGDSAPGDCNDPRSANFTVTPSDMTVTLDASISTPNSGRCAIASYDWDMGDGADPFPPVVGKQTTYTYAAPGTYDIELVTSNPGGSEHKTISVTVPSAGPTPTSSPTPSPTPSPSPTSSAGPICSMVPTFTFTQQGNSSKFNFYGAYTGQPAPESWYWTYGDGHVAFGQAPSRHDYNGNGPYTVTLTITNGSCSGTTSQSVTP